MANRLINETSPYLLQHAYNPVDWYPWGNEALQRAKIENKPILVSIGYAACHWCHVMEKESFENEETAAFMNEHFVNIKIDREERPDLDHIYMDAVQTMTGSGGWPLNVFLTPEAKPFYGGTYFPPKRAFNRSSWKEVLVAVSNAFREKRNEIDSQAENLTAHLLQSNSFGTLRAKDASSIFSEEKIDDIFRTLMSGADREHGGFGKEPKFPQTFALQFLLRYYFVTQAEEALKQACLSLDKMIEGGIYDQLGGGFARYSTDSEWFVPHFEKMLYDNALLVSILSEAYQLTKKERYREVIDETIGFVQRELLDPAGGFYAALDADSEGEEGKFYEWEYGAVKKLLGDTDSEIFCKYFDIKIDGNLPRELAGRTGKNLLHVKKPLELFAVDMHLSIEELKGILQKGKLTLLAERDKRTRPSVDNKTILGWNALMNTACSKAFSATGKDEYRQLAINNMRFLLANFKNQDPNCFYHVRTKGKTANFAFLDDYAFLVQALLHLQEITGDIEWSLRAKEIVGYVMNNFMDEKTGFFFFSDAKQADAIIRKKEVYDGATPSGNATMAYNIYQLSIFFNISEWRTHAEALLTSLARLIVEYPTSFGVWACLFMEMTFGTEEIAVVGKNSYNVAKRVLAEYIPHKVFVVSERAHENIPVLAGKSPNDIPLIYLCKDYSCLKPVSDPADLLKLVNIRNKN